jgi:hypothetical protein
MIKPHSRSSERIINFYLASKKQHKKNQIKINFIAKIRNEDFLERKMDAAMIQWRVS